MIAGYYHHSRFFQITLFDNQPKNGDVHFNIMSYNVLNFGKGDSQKREQILNQIQKANPDIVCFQEYYSFEKESQGITKKIKKKEIGMKFMKIIPRS